jgi:excinuclease UvrABC helicase subunit UvrB
MFAVARAMISLHQERKSAARQILESAIREIETMPVIDTPAFQFERARSIKYLRSTLKQVQEQKSSPLDRMRKELEAAVEEEDYEKAARLRDELRDMKKSLEQ